MQYASSRCGPRQSSNRPLQQNQPPQPEIVFARTSPQQKLQIVEQLQRLGEVRPRGCHCALGVQRSSGSCMP